MAAVGKKFLMKLSYPNFDLVLKTVSSLRNLSNYSTVKGKLYTILSYSKSSTSI